MPYRILAAILQEAKEKQDPTKLNNAWKARRCFIVGGGPSLSGFDFTVLRDDLTIGVNRVVEYIDCDILFSIDVRFYGWITKGELGQKAKESFERYDGLKVVVFSGNHPAESTLNINTREELGLAGGLGKGIFPGNNSGFAALQLAYHLGANPIYLLGFDMKYDRSRVPKTYWSLPKNAIKTHFHEGYPGGDRKGAIGYKGIRLFDRLAPMIKDKGVKVYNCSPDSDLQCFDSVDINKVLEGQDIPYGVG